MSRSTRHLAALGTASALALVLAACAAPNPEAVDPSDCVTDGATLQVRYPATAQASIDIAVPAFEAAYPGVALETAELAGANYTEYAQQVIGDIASGLQIDVVNIGHDQVRLFTDTYEVQPFDTTLLGASYDAEFLPIGQVGGEQYAIPYQVSVPGLYINRDALAAAGVDPDVEIDDLAALLDTAIEVTASTGSPSIGVNSGVSADDWYTQALVQSLGGSYVDDGMPAFASPEGEEAWGFYAQASAEGALLHSAFADTLGAFVTGSAPFLVLSTAAVPLIAGQVADSFEWDLRLLPVSSDLSFAAGGNSWISIADDPCRAALGQAFVAEVVSADALAPSLTGASYLPVDTQIRADMLADDELDPRLRGIYEADLTLTAFGGWPGTTTPEVQQVIADMTTRIVGGADVAAELEATSAEIEGIVG